MAVMKRKQPDARPSTKKVKLPIIEPEVEQSETEGSEEELLDEESEEEDESEAEIASEADSEEEEASAEGGFASEQDAVEQEELKGQVTKKKKIKVEDAAPADDTPLSQVTFASLGLIEPLCEACEALKYKHPTEIQRQAIPIALQGRDIIGLAQTGSGKTAAFGLPLLQALMEDPRPLFACILAPTRELAFQISEAVSALGSIIDVRVATIVGGVDMMSQAIALAKKPHVIVASPGRLLDHLENTKGFNLRGLRYLIMDEADRLLNMDFGPAIDKLLEVIPKERRTMLFSATMTSKVAKLQRASLVHPVKVSVDTKYTTVSTLLQYYLFIPHAHKDVYLAHTLNLLAGNTGIIFVSTCAQAQRLAILLRHMGFPAIPLHGQMPQTKRLGSLNKFKSGDRTLLIATDVAARGLDIPAVDLVINYDLPQASKEYIHRVGRTARAGRAGKAITMVSQYDIELYQRIEKVLGKKLPLWETNKEEVMAFMERVGEAQRHATQKMKDEEINKKGKGKGSRYNHDDQDREETIGSAALKKHGGKPQNTKGRGKKMHK